jgi:hypothetical protein
MTKSWAQLQDEFNLPTGGAHQQWMTSTTAAAGSKYLSSGVRRGGGGPASPPVVPTLVDGKFTVKIAPPETLKAPFFRYMGAYMIDPEAVMTVTFQGVVLLPDAGEWEVGLVQNVYIDNLTMRYSRGGQITINNGVVLRLDRSPEAKERDSIWMKQAVSKLTNDQPNTARGVAMEFDDNPNLETAIKGRRSRCHGKIDEFFQYAEHSFLCLAGLVAKKGTRVFQLAVTQEPYGFRWTFDVPDEPGSVDMDQAFDWQPFVPRRILLPPFPGNRLLRTVPPDANTWVNEEHKIRVARYEGDCTTTSAPWEDKK